MPVGLEVKIQTYQIAWKQMFFKEELGDPNNMFPTDFGTFPDRGPADLVGNTFGFRPMPVGLEVAIQIIQMPCKQISLRKSWGIR